MNKDLQNPRLSVEKAKKVYPTHPEKSLGPFVKLQWLMVKSRRTKGGLDESEFLEYLNILEENIDVISKWHERWICSIFDTLGENGNPVFLVFSAIRMMEKLNKPVKNSTLINQFSRSAVLSNPDIHKNLSIRVDKNLGEMGFTKPLIHSLLNQIDNDPNSILGRFSLLTGSSVSQQMKRKLKHD